MSLSNLLKPALWGGMLAAWTIALSAACGGGSDSGGDTNSSGELSGDISGDGSSTVYPVTQAVAEEFGNLHPGVHIAVGISGTGGGFEKFCRSELDFTNASRPIKDVERDMCANDGLEYIDYEVAYDGISIVVHPSNSFIDCITAVELKKIWDVNSEVDSWSDIRQGFPDQPINLFGPGADSGTFDYFTAVISGTEGASRGDFTASEDDNVLIQGIAGDENSLGYFGFAYYSENKDKLKLLKVDKGDGNCVEPTHETILSGLYNPLSRPLYVYVEKGAMKRPEVKEFMRFYLTDGVALVEEVGYVAAPAEIYEEGLAKLELP